MDKQRCKNCYWYRWEDSVWGYCWRFPPKYEIRSVFPKVKYDKVGRPEVEAECFACGEFKDKFK